MRLFGSETPMPGPISAEVPPVIIVGAGPVGLTLALGLVSRGVRVEVYEALPTLSPEARCSTIHPATLEIFDEFGAVDTVLAHGHRVQKLQYWEREARTVVAELEYSAIADDAKFPFRVQCPQSVLTRVLKPKVEASPLGAVHMGHRLVSFEDDGQGVTAHFETETGAKVVTGRYLCGCDGASSTTRHHLGLSFEGDRYADRFLLVPTDVDLRAHFPGLAAASYFFSPEEWTITLQLPDVTRIVFRVGRDEDADTLLQDDNIRKRIWKFLGRETPFTIHAKSIYNVHKRAADTFRVGNVLLVGDAAHLNNPMGGMGMNGGIQDAYVLAHLLPAVLAGGPESLLDEYNAQRMAAQTDMVHVRTDKNYRDMTAKTDAARRDRNAEFAAIAADPRATRKYLLEASMLGHRV